MIVDLCFEDFCLYFLANKDTTTCYEVKTLKTPMNKATKAGQTLFCFTKQELNSAAI